MRFLFINFHIFNTALQLWYLKQLLCWLQKEIQTKTPQNLPFYHYPNTQPLPISVLLFRCSFVCSPTLCNSGKVSCNLCLSFDYHLFCKGFLNCISVSPTTRCVHMCFLGLNAFMHYTFNLSDTDTLLHASHSAETGVTMANKALSLVSNTSVYF